MDRYEFYDALIENEQSLQHHGVLGMHWGVRRYQNKDGSWKRGHTSYERSGKLKKALRVAGTAAVIGAAGYAAYKTGANRRFYSKLARSTLSKTANKTAYGRYTEAVKKFAKRDIYNKPVKSIPTTKSKVATDKVKTYATTPVKQVTDNKMATKVPKKIVETSSKKPAIELKIDRNSDVGKDYIQSLKRSNERLKKTAEKTSPKQDNINDITEELLRKNNKMLKR